MDCNAGLVTVCTTTHPIVACDGGVTILAWVHADANGTPITATGGVNGYPAFGDGTVYSQLDGSPYTPSGVPTAGPCVELDVVSYAPYLVCVDGVTWYARQTALVDNQTGAITPAGVEYSNDGINWTPTAPAGTITAGPCVELDVVSYAPYLVCVDGVTWYARQTATINNESGAITPAAVEYSDDGIGWTATAPAGAITAGPCPPGPEFDTTSITPWHVCAGGVPTLVRQYWTTDNTTGVPTPSGLEWSTDGVAWQLPPIPTPIITGACPPGPELDVVSYAPYLVCVNNVTWYARQTGLVDNQTGTITPAGVEYSDDGINWAPTAPDGLITAGACPPGPELDVVSYAPYLVCVSGSAWYARQTALVDNQTGAITPAGVEYSNDGINWTAIAPAGTITAGPCQRDDINAVSVVPWQLCVDCVDVLARQVGLVDETTGTVTFNAVEYSTDGGATWTTNPPVGAVTPGPCARCCPQTITMLDVVETITVGNNTRTGIFTKFDGAALLPGDPLGNDFDPVDAAAIAAVVPVGSDFTIVIDYNAVTYTITVRLNSAYAGTGGNLDLVVVTTLSPITGENPSGPFTWYPGSTPATGPDLVDYNCVPFMRMVTTACDGTVTVNDIGFDGLPYTVAGVVEVAGACPECEQESRPVCIDTGAGIVEGERIACRNPNGTLRWVRLEDGGGNQVTGDIVDCACAAVGPQLTARATYTGTGVVSHLTDKFGTDCAPVTWQVTVYQGANDTPIYTSSVSPVLATVTAGQAWLAANSGGYAELTEVTNPGMGTGVNRWSLPTAGQYLVVIEEIAGGLCTSPCYYCVANWDIAAIGGNGWWDAISYTPIMPSTVGMTGWMTGP